MQLTLIVPGLLALPEASLAASRPLARFARYATRSNGEHGIAAATLAALGLADAPAAPLLALGAGLDPAPTRAGSDPVSLVAVATTFDRRALLLISMPVLPIADRAACDISAVMAFSFVAPRPYAGSAHGRRPR